MKILPAAVFLWAISVVAAQTPSPAQKAIGAAQGQIKNDPAQSQGYNDLAKALVRRGRETGNPDYYNQAERAIADSLRVEPDNFEAYKARVTVLLGRREYAAALDLARKLNKRIPDDVLLYGWIGEACMELGDYAEAEAKIQWMVNMRRVNVPATIRGAFLRSAIGDMEGALEWLTSAFKLTSFTETEERAWLLTHIARLRLQTGKPDIAEQLLNQASGLFPDYYFTLDSLAETRSAQGKYAEAADLLRRAQKLAPHPRRLFYLAIALKQSGSFAEFERSALNISDKPDNANRELIFYYADYAHKPAEALRIARAEISKRQDIATLDAYAWALYVNGQYQEARAELDKALKIGVRDSRLFDHAAAIAEKLKDPAAAAGYQRKARELRP